MRERKNYVCFLPGFERAILTKTNTLFAKFQAQELAEQAIEILTYRKYDDDDPKSVPVSAQMAKNELAENCKQTAVPFVASAPPPMSFATPAASGKGGYVPAGKGKVVVVPQGYAPAYGKGKTADWGYTDPGQAAWGNNAAKRQRTAQEPTEIFTLAVLGMKSKGLTEETVTEAFMQTPGFLGTKASPQTDGLFAKFETPQHAQDALVSLETHGVHAEMARRNADW